MFILFSCTMLHDRLIPDVVTLTDILVTWSWHVYTWYLPCYTKHLISDTGTCHAILDTWYLTLVLDMLSLTWHAITRLTCYHLVLVHLTWYCGTCIILHIHAYHFYGDLTWLLYCYQTSGTPELLYSWTPVFLNPCNRETPDIILLLIPIIR